MAVTPTGSDAEWYARGNPVRGVGRWSLWRTAADPAVPQENLTEQWAWQLLRCWGVMFRDLLTREAGAPQWWELVQVYRRLEARGEIRAADLSPASRRTVCDWRYHSYSSPKA